MCVHIYLTICVIKFDVPWKFRGVIIAKLVGGGVACAVG